MKNKVRKAVKEKEKETKPTPFEEWYPDPPDDPFDEEDEEGYDLEEDDDE